jgi:hypothetical protein
MTLFNSTFVKISALVLMMGAAGGAHAATDAMEPVSSVAGTAATSPTAPATPLRYSLPWQLRPVSAGNAVRLDSAAAVFNDTNGNVDIAVTTVLSASLRLTSRWTPTLRLGLVGNNAPGAALDGSSFVNPLMGATWARTSGPCALAFFGATTIPIGTGAGDVRYDRAARSNLASMVARPADAAMFAVNYATAIAGADFAYVSHGFTAQGEATLLQYVRVRGGDGAGANAPFRTQAAAGLHLGYFIGSHFSLSGDLTYQRWLAHPTTANLVTVAVGPRAHFRLGNQASLRPGLSLVRGLDRRGFDAPLITGQTTGVQIDLPVTF